MSDKVTLYIMVLLMTPFFSSAQSDHTANDRMPAYEAPFGFGTNVGAYPPWRDENLANIAAGNKDLHIKGLGITSFRPELPELFVDYWGYDIRVEAFEHYHALGMRDHVLFVGHPAPHHRDSTFYCLDHSSKLFKNLYAPIWDDGENGTPVNDTNYYARYIYLLAMHYGQYVRFWEVWNEPDLDLSGNAILPPGTPGNWWENNPGPCETQIFAPIFHYIRMLRITYEVVKSLYPDDFIAVGGLGNYSYLDAILRNTDNPVGGSVNAEYPHKGGAYFDCMSFHSYPHLDGSLRYWSDAIGGFVYNRHSDAAVDGIFVRQDGMEDVLFQHGYDGYEFPEKLWILTEVNIPRKAFDPIYLGSDEAQRNFLIKALVLSQANDIRQFHVYSLADTEPESEADYEFEMMGLVKNLSGLEPHGHELTEAGIGYRTCSQMIKGHRYDEFLTLELNLPPAVRGAAFRDEGGDITFVLWAVTSQDNTEAAYAEYSFPSELNIDSLVMYRWDYSEHSYTVKRDPSFIGLSGAPVFLKPIYKTSQANDLSSPKVAVNILPNPSNGNFSLRLHLPRSMSLSAELYSITGEKAAAIFEERNFPKGESRFRVNRKDLPSGIYFLRITDGSKSVLKKVFIGK